jgi:hypothetical protein
MQGTAAASAAAAKRATAEASAADARDSWNLDELLLLGCLADIVFYAWATYDSDPAYQRYLTSLVVFGSMLAGRVTARVVARLRAKVALRALAAFAAVMTAVNAAAFGYAVTSPRSDNGIAELASSLEVRGLTVGIGAYWNSSITTVTSGGRVVIRPVATDASGQIARFSRQSTADWYRGVRFQFLAYDTSQPWYSVNQTTAESQFGQPSTTYQVGTFRVLVWNSGITISPTTLGG